MPPDLTVKPFRGSKRLLTGVLVVSTLPHSSYLWAEPVEILGISERPEVPVPNTSSISNTSTRSRSISGSSTLIYSTAALKTGVAQSRNLLGQTAAAIGLGLDSIFGSPDKSQPNESAFLLRSGIRHNRNGEISYVNGLTFKADLPSTRNKFQLLIRLDDEHQIESSQAGHTSENNTVATPTLASPAGTLDQRNVPTSKSFLQTSRAGLFFRYIYQVPLSPWQTTLDTGWQVDTANFNAEAVSYFRIGRNIQVGEWLLRPVPSLFWTEGTGGGIGVTLHTQTYIDSITSLQSSSSVNYLWDDDTLYYQHGWQLVKAFSQDLRVTYNITLYANDEVRDPIDEANISATLRRRLDGQWLFFSVTPTDSLRSDNNFKQDLSITFQLEAKFGSQY